MNHRIGIAAATLFTLTSLLNAAPAHARYRPDPDHRPCVSRREFRQMNRMNPVRRDVIEDRFEVHALNLDANYYVDPANPHLYPVAYKVCGYDPTTEQILIINYRKTSDAWVWAFRLNRQWPLPPHHGHLKVRGSRGTIEAR